MVVSPDLLLNLQSSSKTTSGVGTASRNATQAGRDEPSRFAEVYAKERQGKPVERKEGPQARDNNASPAEDQVADEGGTRMPDVSENGNDLPMASADTDQAVENVDPAALLGLGLQGETVEEADTPSGSELLIGLQPAIATADVEADAEPELPLMAQRAQPQAEIQLSAKGLPIESDSLADSDQATEAKAQFSGLLSQRVLAQDSQEPTGDEELADLLDQAVVTKDSRSASPTEATPDRLNMLTQAIQQSQQAAQRPVLVPGQPLQLQQPGLSEAVVERVMWLSSQNLRSAEIQLDPAELGRMEIRIDMNKDISQVTFLSPHASVRDALEGQLQRLRDMFAQQGMNMDVNVSDQSLARGGRGEADGQGDEGRTSRAAIAEQEGEGEITQGTLEITGGRSLSGRGLVDYYA